MNSNLFKYIKKISIYTLVFIFCFMIGNNNVKAEWEMYQGGWSQYNGYWTGRLSAKSPDGWGIPGNEKKACGYKAVNAWGYTYDAFLYYSDNNSTVYGRGTNGRSALKWNTNIYIDREAKNTVTQTKSNGITTAQGLYNLCWKQSYCVCPIIYFYNWDKNNDGIGYSDDRISPKYGNESSAAIEFVPDPNELANGSKICVGTRADFALYKNNSSFKKPSDNNTFKTNKTTTINGESALNTTITTYHNQLDNIQSDVWKDETKVKELFEGEDATLKKDLDNLKQAVENVKTEIKNNKYDELNTVKGNNEVCDDVCGPRTQEICPVIKDVEAALASFSASTYETNHKTLVEKFEAVVGKINEIYPEIDTSATEGAMSEYDAGHQTLVYTVTSALNMSLGGALDVGGTVTCDSLLSEDLVVVIKTAFKIVCIAAPILLIVLSAVDLGQVVISQDQDAMKKAVSKVIKRGIAALVIFFIPFLVNLLLEMPGIRDWVDKSCETTIFEE